MTPDNLMTVVLLFTGIIVVPTFFMSLLAEWARKKDRS